MVYVVGALGIAANVIIYQQKSGKKLVFWKLISDVLWALQYIMLGAYSGAAVAVIGIFREIVFYNNDKKWARSRLWLLFFICVSVLSGILTFKSVFSLLPMVASVLSILGFWRKSPSLSRVLAFPISASMLTYDIYAVSYMGIVNEVLTIISAIIGIKRYLKTKETK